MDQTKPNARLDAILIGVLFIISTSFSIGGMLVGAPILAEADFLTAIADNAGTMQLSAMLLFIGAGVIPGMAIVFYPYFRRDSTVMAIGYVVLRAFEAVFYFLGILFAFGLIALARDAVDSGGDTAAFMAPAMLLQGLQETSYTFGTLLFFGMSALVLSILLYRTRLVPRWLSVWAFIGAVFVIVQGLLAVFEVSNEMLEGTLFIPIAVNEMVFAVWLIVFGFDKPALEKLMARAPQHD